MREVISETMLLDDPELRQECMEGLKDRMDILDKVKKLILIPEIQCMTSVQVAEYFEVSVKTIKNCYRRHKDELDRSGVFVATPTMLEESLDSFKMRTPKGNQQYTICIATSGLRCLIVLLLTSTTMILTENNLSTAVFLCSEHRRATWNTRSF